MALAARELDAAFADHGVIAIGEVFDKIVSVGEFGGLLDFFFGGIRAAVSDIIGYGAVEEGRFLRDVSDGVAEGVLSDVADVLAVDIDGASVDVGEAQEQFGEGGLTGTRDADKADGLTGGDSESEIRKERVGLLGVLEGDVLKFDGGMTDP